MTRSLFVGLVVLTIAVGCIKNEAPQRKVNANALGIDDLEAPPPVDATPPTRPSEGTGMTRGNTNFQSGAGAIQNVRKAGLRAVTMNDMNQLGIIMFQMELDTNRMPTAADVKTALRQDAPNILALIEDGTIILTGTRDRGGLWAYETESDKLGGIGLIGGKPQRMQADDIKQMLGK